MKSMLRFVSCLAAACLLLGAAPLSSVSSTQAVPEWFLHAIEARTRDGGVWLTDNSDYAEEDDGIEAFGMEWHAGLGGRSMVGRLYSVRDGEEAATHWQFRVFWHPAEEAVLVYQFAADGTVGWGPMIRRDDGVDVIDQTFAGVDGTRIRVLHESRHEGDRDIDQSYVWEEGEWQPRRSYTWTLQR